jgi:hypothetical protein
MRSNRDPGKNAWSISRGTTRFWAGRTAKFPRKKWFLSPDCPFQQSGIRPRIRFLSRIRENLRHCMLGRAGEEGASDDDETEKEVDWTLLTRDFLTTTLIPF